MARGTGSNSFEKSRRESQCSAQILVLSFFGFESMMLNRGGGGWGNCQDEMVSLSFFEVNSGHCTWIWVMYGYMVI